MSDIRVTIWNEFRHEKSHEEVRKVYPEGIHEALAQALRQHDDLSVRTAWLDQPENGLTAEVLSDTDVLLWWGHMAHQEVADEVVDRVHQAVLNGMGLIPLHSAHYSKIFRRLMGTSCSLNWREADDKERLWVIAPSHPLAAGLPPYFELPAEEMYGEFFDIPAPDELVLVSWFTGGEVFRSGCCYNRGHGRIFYFRPGHETYPTYYDANVLRILTNAIHWCAPTPEAAARKFGNTPPVEDVK
ncbi:MAG: trehalose utilization protein ThuA [candidate division WS1 bacterium]|jgi:trehalose utilization protein|nr:trehalose utilization protein ThuA [candidate division WS1 bacterium]